MKMFLNLYCAYTKKQKDARKIHLVKSSTPNKPSSSPIYNSKTVKTYCGQKYTVYNDSRYNFGSTLFDDVTKFSKNSFCKSCLNTLSQINSSKPKNFVTSLPSKEEESKSSIQDRTLLRRTIFQDE